MHSAEIGRMTLVEIKRRISSNNDLNRLGDRGELGSDGRAIRSLKGWLRDGTEVATPGPSLL